MKNKSYSTNHLIGNISLFRKFVVCLILLAFTGVEMFAQTTIIGAGANVGATSSNAGPIYRSSAGSAFDFSKHVYLYTAAELSAAGINPGDIITSVAWNKSITFGTAATNFSSIWRVYIKNSATVPTAGWSSSNFATQITGSTLAYNNTAQVIPLTTGYITLTFSSPFTYTGGNLEIASDWDCSVFAGSPATGGFSWRSDNLANTCFGGSNSTSAVTMALQTIRPQIRLGYTAGAPCAGLPNPGNTIASAAVVCNGSNVTLNLQNSTAGGGVSYVWEHSNDNVNWTPFGANANSASFTMGATPKYFHCIVTCAGNPGTSNSVLVNINTAAFPEDFTSAIFPPNCFSETDVATNYLTREASNGFGLAGSGSVRWNFYNAGDGIVLTLTSPTLSAPVGANTSLKFDVAGTTYNTGEIDHIFVEESSDGGTSWTLLADLNNAVGGALNTNGGTSTSNFVPTSAQWASLEFNASATANRFRLRGVSNFGNSVFVDNLSLYTLPPCIDPPTAGTAQSNILQFCNTSSVNLNLSLTGTSSGIGQTYQWENSLDNVTYSPIGGATTAAWTENGVSVSYYYRCQVTCGASTVPSASVFVQTVPPPVAGTITGPASAYASQAATYSSGTASGNLQWIGRLFPSTTWLLVPSGTNDPQNIFFGNPGTWEVRLVASNFGCLNDSSNIVTTVVTVQGDAVCEAVPVNIGVNGPYSNVGATLEPGESQPPVGSCTGNSTWCTAASNTVWFTFTVPAGGSGRYGLGFSPNNWDSQVAIWSASSCGDLLTGAAVFIAANDDSTGNSPFNSYASAHCLTPGQTYYIQVDGYSNVTNSAFGLRIDDLGPANPSFAVLPAVVCQNDAAITLVPAVAGGTFSGPGVVGSNFDPSLAGSGFHSITYTLSGLDFCYSSSQSIQVDEPSFVYYPDVDNDSYGDSEGITVSTCSAVAPSGYVVDATDCDDNAPLVNPGATEICNGIDDDCANGIDDGLTFLNYYVDGDADGFGAGASTSSCNPIVGSVLVDGDCVDNNAAVNPGATEVCNGIDDNCANGIDEGFDVDNDGYTSCGGDCDDNNAAVNPAATEVCNGVDDDCNLSVDDGLTFITYYADVDSDTYGDASSTVSTCDGAPVGYILNNTDCNDANAAVNPAATEICNLIDDNCNGLTDENVLVAGPISGPSVQCMAVVTGSATFSTSSVFDATGYSWTVPNGMIIVSGQGTTSIFVSWAPQAVSNGIIGSISVTANNSCGAGPASSLAVDINYTAPVRPSSISGPTKLCPGDNGVYSVAPVARASSYVWTVPAGMSIISGAGSNVITVDVNGAYLGGVVSARAANNCGQSPNRDRSVTVSVPAASASISGPATGVCGASGVVYSAAAVVSATGYNWSAPAGATIMSGQGSISITVDFDGAYAGGNVSVNATNSCGTGAARNLNVSGAPGLPGVIAGDITICPGQSGVAYGVATVTGAASYLWSLPGGTTITSGQGTKDILATWGTNPASGLNLSVNASNGCGTSANRVLNGISISVAHCGPRFGDQGEITGLNVYPNPTADRATVVFTSTEGADFNIKMVDLSGRTIMNERGTAANGLNQREVNVSEMSAGIYFVVIETNNVVEQIKMIVE